MYILRTCSRYLKQVAMLACWKEKPKAASPTLALARCADTKTRLADPAVAAKVPSSSLFGGQHPHIDG